MFRGNHLQNHHLVNIISNKIYCGICGIWKVNKFIFYYIKINNKNARFIIRRIKDSDDTMDGIFYITNDKYKQQFEQYKILRTQQRQNRGHKNRNNNQPFEPILLPELPDKFGQVKMKYKTVNEIEMKFMNMNDSNDSYKGMILEDRNNITFNNIVELTKIESVNKLNKDPNAYACNYKLILKLRDIPKSFIDNITQNHSAKTWVNKKLNKY